MKTRNICTLMISRSIPLKMRNFSDMICKENQTFYSKILLAGSRGRLIEEIKDDNIIGCISLACWITKTTDMHSEYVIRIAFTRQKMTTRKCSSIRLYVHYLYFFFLQVHFPIVLLFVTGLTGILCTEELNFIRI